MSASAAVGLTLASLLGGVPGCVRIRWKCGESEERGTDRFLRKGRATTCHYPERGVSQRFELRRKTCRNSPGPEVELPSDRWGARLCHARSIYRTNRETYEYLRRAEALRE